MKFLAVTDLHYADRFSGGSDDRRHSMSLIKLKEALSYSKDCDFIINLGDTADSFPDSRPQTVLFEEIASAFRENGLLYYSIIGNHDTATDKNEYCRIFGMKGRYYSFDAGEYTGIVLDACLNDINDPFPKKEIDWDKCFIDTVQKQWLIETLERSSKKVLIFTHCPFIYDDRSKSGNHLIKNRDEIMDILERSGKVFAVFSGHYHKGTYGVSNGIHYVTFASMSIGEKNSFALVEVENGKINIQGYGNIPSQIL